ncbi:MULTISPECIES: arylsulfatase [unclassified Paraburkholderia]|uniref:arylsulfatase n=1 Tax=unclassified Paraburkholderia TaxID=2615204 RepID=UPI001621AD89|nr:MULTISPECIES: arylsulfatase [unclassified Paraburkholderia]MBB5444556.1 arylsulfatase [Paraburkholderia sp. WSM4177]MBB5485380.1 arylsulfatase [Paraburkholderia sp. WSM4180]
MTTLRFRRTNFRPTLRLGVIGAAVASLVTLASCGEDNLPSASAASSAAPASTPVVAQKRPNILYIMADDLGYSDIHAFGGEINTPNLDALVQSGRILTNHHTGTVCAITRSMLISGTDHHLVGEGTMGVPTDERKGLPGYEGYLNDRALSVAQLLKDGGYHTYMAGKWHIGSGIVGSATGSGQTPDQWGFEHSYALLGGAATNHFAHELAGSKNYTEDGKYVQPGQPGQPGGVGGSPEVFYSTDFYTQRLISYIDSNKGDGKPFFAYAAYTSPHWPLQVPDPYLHNYVGKYDAGYDAIRDARIARQKALGIIAQDFVPFGGASETLAASPATANNGTANAKYVSAVHSVVQGYTDYGPGYVDKKWDSLSPAEKKAQARYMEIYAGMVENLDHNIGLLIQHLKDIGEYDNTFIVFQSDNGAEGWPIDSGADPTATDTANAADPTYSQLGTDNGKQNAQRLQYGLRWAEVSATPFRLTKGYSGEGGVSTPLIVHLPGQTSQKPTLREFTHVTDNTATFLAVAHIAPPTTPAPALINTLTGVDQNKGKVVYNNRYVYPITGQSLLPQLEDQSTAPVHGASFGDEAYGRGYLRSADGRWKALWTEPPLGPVDGHWQLYDMSADRGETQDVSAQNQSIIDGLVQQWNDYMTSVGGVEPLRPRGYY